jgi:hypothetical protein
MFPQNAEYRLNHLAVFASTLCVCIPTFDCALCDTIWFRDDTKFYGKVLSADSRVVVVDKGCSGDIAKYTWKMVVAVRTNSSCKPPIMLSTGAPNPGCERKGMKCVVTDSVENDKMCYANIVYKDGILHLYGRDDRPSLTEAIGSYDLVHQTYTDNLGTTTKMKNLSVHFGCDE